MINLRKLLLQMLFVYLSGWMILFVVGSGRTIYVSRDEKLHEVELDKWGRKTVGQKRLANSVKRMESNQRMNKMLEKEGLSVTYRTEDE